MSDEFYALIFVILFLFTLIASPFLIYQFYKAVKYLLTKSKYKNVFLLFVCGMFMVGCIYNAYFGYGMINKDPVNMIVRMYCVYGAIFFAAVGFSGMVKNGFLKALFN